jgi:hypothetical protein
MNDNDKDQNNSPQIVRSTFESTCPSAAVEFRLEMKDKETTAFVIQCKTRQFFLKLTL